MVAMVVEPVVTTHPHVLCTLERRLFSSIVCCTLMEKVQIDEPCEKNRSLFQGLSWTKSCVTSIQQTQVVSVCSGPMLWHVFKAQVVGHVRNPAYNQSINIFGALMQIFACRVVGT